MTIYYTLTFGILVTEMILFGLLVLPLPSRWRRAMLKFASTSPVMVKGLHLLKIIFGQRIDTEAEEDKQHHHDYGYETSVKAKKFYTQRNLYLTGFTLFLSLILERTSTLVLNLLQREEELKKAKNENLESTKDQQKLIEMEEEYKNKVANLTEQIKELKRQKLDYETLKKQADQQAKEYNRLADEFNQLEKELSSSNEAKKDI
ncbi:B-cell receptor-associated protein 31-like-domain-containing protein [Cokeromyces recurvatus]|uniref:B-cell receptor-associated protein 31-like-domain-containing protein n=1 Tax=Cokeromyces recurvatus TaxID=90255 RepID=UPI00222046D6|nr:B-cell receptor-associated protein 31-like-domain-containing protein [Cokeromyces recurvatus]KAI7901393.1 B-cell receptor-associated protein 31-like-domain-containing protein [Cokeromyces recurvatus]